ncbi:MAG: ubiquitin-conjugating enzyme E2 [Candidatus Norongarragalinales archaeon]
MPMLPEAIWRRRLESERDELATAGEKFECNADCTVYVVSVRGPALFKNGGKLSRRDSHSVQITLKREYPYAGGIDVVWLTPIFHPNIRPSDGKVCIQLLNEWSESQSVASLVNALRQLLVQPNPFNALDKEAADFFADHAADVNRVLGINLKGVEATPQPLKPRVVNEE